MGGRGTSNVEGGPAGRRRSQAGASLRDHADGLEPGFGEVRPAGDGIFCGAQTESMAAVGEEMHFGGDVRFF